MTLAAALDLFAFTMPAAAEQIPSLCSKERNQAEMNRCADQLLIEATTEMKKTLKALLEETDKDNHKYVNEAQEAWQTWADKECLSRIGGSPNRGGTIWPMMNLQCHVGPREGFEGAGRVSGRTDGLLRFATEERNFSRSVVPANAGTHTPCHS